MVRSVPPSQKQGHKFGSIKASGCSCYGTTFRNTAALLTTFQNFTLFLSELWNLPSQNAAQNSRAPEHSSGADNIFFLTVRKRFTGRSNTFITNVFCDVLERAQFQDVLSSKTCSIQGRLLGNKCEKETPTCGSALECGPVELPPGSGHHHCPRRLPKNERNC